MEKNCRNCKYFNIFREIYYQCIRLKEKHYIPVIKDPDNYVCENWKSNEDENKK